MILNGIAHTAGDDINTDYISPGRYKARSLSYEEMATHILEDVDPEFAARVQNGDFVVAGENFGCGSSRETAPRVLKAAGVSIVLARSFARIFFRNCISIGLPVMECDTRGIREGERLEVDVYSGTVRREDGSLLKATPIPPALLSVLMDGGMTENFRKYGTFKLDE